MPILAECERLGLGLEVEEVEVVGTALAVVEADEVEADDIPADDAEAETRLAPLAAACASVNSVVEPVIAPDGPVRGDVV